MTIQFVGGLLIGIALTFMGVVSASEYLSSKNLLEIEQAVLDLMKERDKYKKLYLQHRNRVDSD